MNTSMCSSPRKPTRKPCPSAVLDSSATATDESLSASRVTDFFKSSNEAASVGYSDANTAGLGRSTGATTWAMSRRPAATMTAPT